MKTPNLTKEQENLIEKATFNEVYEWMNELHSGRKVNSDINKLWNYLNEVLKEKA